MSNDLVGRTPACAARHHPRHASWDAWTGGPALGRLWLAASLRQRPGGGAFAFITGSSITDMAESEGASILAELTPPYMLLRPAEQVTPVVFCSPHSGR